MYEARIPKKNTLYLLTGLALGVAVFLPLRWPALSVPQRLAGSFFLAIIFRLWEEGRFPGGFTRMITQRVGVHSSRPALRQSRYGGLCAGHCFRPALQMFRLNRPTSPGLATAVFLLLPISLSGIVYAEQHDLINARSWLPGTVYIIGALMLAQQIVVRASGMKSSEFMRRVRGSFSSDA